MSLHKVTNYIPSCDGCGPDCWEVTAPLPAYVTAEGALKRIAADYGWRVQRHDDGTTEMLCPPCADIADTDRAALATLDATLGEAP